MNFLYDYGLFLAKSVTILMVFICAIALVAVMRKALRSKLDWVFLNATLEETQTLLQKAIKKCKPAKLSRKVKRERDKRPTLYLIDFEGDLKASAADSLRTLITAVLSVAQKKDEVVVRLESPGGIVTGYGLAASQLQRVRDKGLPLTVCIDKVAGSGGYLMACVANIIVAAPFSIVGSIGVVAQLPNFHRFLKKHAVDVELITAGEFKRTLTVFGENDEKGRKKFKETLEEIHTAFKNFVMKNRPQVDIHRVSTGEHWLATDAFDLHLVDVIQTSDDFLMEKMEHFNIYHLRTCEKQPMLQRFIKPIARLMSAW